MKILLLFTLEHSNLLQRVHCGTTCILQRRVMVRSKRNSVTFEVQGEIDRRIALQHTHLRKKNMTGEETKSDRSTLERWIASQKPLFQGRKEEIDSAILERLKDIAPTFHCSTKFGHVWKGRKGVDRPKKLKQSVENRLGLQYDMVKRFLQIQKCVNIALVEGDHGSKNDVMQLEVFKEEWEIIRKLTSSLQSQSEVLFPRAICFFRALKANLLHRKEILRYDARDRRRSEVAEMFLQELLAAFQTTVHIQEIVESPVPLTLAVSFMDPRYRDVILKYHGEEFLKEVRDMIQKCVDHFHLERKSSCAHVEKEDAMKTVPEISEMMELDDEMFADVFVDSTTVSREDEWERYQRLPFCERWKDPLQWWKDREHELPTLSKVGHDLFSRRRLSGVALIKPSNKNIITLTTTNNLLIVMET
eukprot:TRINITY_DN80198_c0_g1_i1.p1 TRINITY_DN80198_c0_g1~~TRINITY_DN80198_c0_g1_i1.p1  ORF type:complete len:418 (-),score=87.40 TRINITY_DN80198_c0_g1_i1:135-1388(-)